MKADDVDVLRSKLSLIYGYKERILRLFSVELSFTTEPTLDSEEHLQSDHDGVENADPVIVRVRLMSDTSQESLDQAKVSVY